MKYVYPAIFTPVEDGVLVDFPDLDGCYTDGDNMTDAFDYAEDALNLWLWHNESEHRNIPVPSKPENITVPQGSTLAVVKADTLAYACANDTKAIRKSVSIPAWLDNFVSANNISLSNFLQNALIREYSLQA